jgi:hypothetical protein
MRSSSFTITSTASRIVDKDNLNRTIYLHVIGNGTVYLGGSNVSSSNGLGTEKHAVPFQMILPLGEELWAATANGVTETVRVLIPDVD